MWTVIVHSISVVSKRESKNIERVVGRLSFRRSSPSLRVMHNDMDHNKSPDTRKAFESAPPPDSRLFVYSKMMAWHDRSWRPTLCFFFCWFDLPRVAFVGVEGFCVTEGLFCFGAGPRPGHRQIKSDVAFVLIFQRRLFPRKWKRVWKCLFPVWKQRLRDTQIFRRITNNRFMQVSCKVFTALRHESRGTEEN